jgi:ABC-type polysaccharide/polyol phosphate export permease
MQQQSLATTAERELVAGIRSWSLWAMLGWTDIRLRYRRSVIGPFWITLSMGTFILLLGVIYARLFNMDIKTYLPFLTAGYLVWGFISAGANEGCNAFHEGGQILKQIRLPYSLHILRVLWRNFIVFLHTLVVFPLVCIYFGVVPTASSLLMLPMFALLYVNMVWIALILGILSTRFRDVQQIVTTTFQIMLLATPVMWPLSALGTDTWIANVNPLYHLVEMVRAPMLGHAPPLLSVSVAIGLVFVNGFVALILLRRASRRIVYWL